MPTKPFVTLAADPPWPYKDKLPGGGRGAAKHYPTKLTVEEIARFPLPPLARDAWLFLWVTATHLEAGIYVAKTWGFRVDSNVVWVKVKRCASCKGTGIERGSITRPCLDCYPLASGCTRLPRMGMGRTVRNAHELFLVCRRGKPKRLSASVPSVIFAPLGEHSEKPPEFFRLVERLAPGPRVELFARARREGWVTLGNQVPWPREGMARNSECPF